MGKFTNLFNPFPSSVPRLAKHSILILEGIIKKKKKKNPMTVATMSR